MGLTRGRIDKVDEKNKKGPSSRPARGPEDSRFEERRVTTSYKNYTTDFMLLHGAHMHHQRGEPYPSLGYYTSS